ncbi:Mur ligase domain-containing protein [Sinomicrobium soli]|uniref:Mur ligase domain-containing protein n=1 Tax=Sinomicrobium sp. N-1-3-6 TaxID=2219864 RepID=UPI001375204F|nr:Mur ligase domain-containing protein [Sinomicrobium sp. N-1-3-6]
MRLHCIGLADPRLFAIARVLGNSGHEVSGSEEKLNYEKQEELVESKVEVQGEGWSDRLVSGNLDGVIAGAGIGEENPELQRARELDVRIYTVPEILYELTRGKTRVVIAGGDYSGTLLSLVLYVMEYHNKHTDAVREKDGEVRIQLSEDNEFVILAGSHLPYSALDPVPQFYHYHPNIVWLTSLPGGDPEIARAFTDRVVKGGIVVYNEDDPGLKAVVEASENPVRKHPYHVLSGNGDGGKVVLDTPEGPMPLDMDDAHLTGHILGAKWLCQHLGVDEEDFYEGIYSYEIS